MLHVSRFTGKVWERENRGYPVGAVPGTTIALLSRPEKMPGPSWSLPAVKSCPYAVFGENSICGTCYADNRGQFRRPEVKRAQAARWAWTLECMKTEAGRVRFIETMIRAINATERLWFRIHDSGDFFSPAYAGCWATIARSTPHVRYWAPTRSWQAPWLDALVALNALPNVTVRPSALHIDAPPPMIEGLAAGTSVTAVGYTCGAPSRGNHCGSCRRCWFNPKTPVTYHLAAGNGLKFRLARGA